MKFVKIMIIASAFYLTYAHAREIHQAVDEPAAPYNLRWGMSISRYCCASCIGIMAKL
ncbi:hypothetical protein ACTXP6_20930, partial [Klebsiella pneumoniae]